MVPEKFRRSSVVIPLCVLVFLVFYLVVGLSMGPLMLESGLTNENFLPVVFSVGGIFLCGSLIRDGLKETSHSDCRFFPICAALFHDRHHSCFLRICFLVHAFL